MLPWAWTTKAGEAIAAARAAERATRFAVMRGSPERSGSYTRETRRVPSRSGYRFDVAVSRKFDAAMPEKAGNALLSPGDFVRHPGRPDWGLGQIQSMVGTRITVNFENAGKLLIDGSVVELEPVELPRR